MIRNRSLDQLEEAIRSYRQSIPQDDKEVSSLEELQADWARDADRIEQIHEAVHRLRDALDSDMRIGYFTAGIPTEELPKLPRQTAVAPLIDLRAIRSSLSTMKRKLPERQVAAIDVVHGLMDHVHKELKKVRATDSHLRGGHKEDEARWAFELLALVSHYQDKSIVDTAEIRDFAGEIWKALDDRLRQELRNLMPPMTWGEILLHFLTSLEDNRGDVSVKAQSNQIGKYLFPLQKFYCILCDQLFSLDKLHLGRFICPRCRARLRKQRERQRKGEANTD